MSSLIKIEKRIDELLLEKNKKLEKITQKTKKHEIIERINIKLIELEIKTKSEKLKTTIMKKGLRIKLMS